MAITKTPSPSPVRCTPPPSSPSPHSRTSTPPPRPSSSQGGGVSVFAPRPMRIALYRPGFPRYGGSMFDIPTERERGTTSPGASVRRSSSASLQGVSENDQENAVAGDGSNRAPVYSPTKDDLDELYKIMQIRSASRTSNSSTSVYRPQALHPRSPNPTHLRTGSDVSDSGTSGWSRKTPEPESWRLANSPASPIARNVARNPMIRDPSFNNAKALTWGSMDAHATADGNRMEVDSKSEADGSEA